MRVNALSIDISGVWSHRQARAVIEATRDEATERGLKVSMVDVSSFGYPHRALLVMVCAKHQTVVSQDDACAVCVQEVSHA